MKAVQRCMCNVKASDGAYENVPDRTQQMEVSWLPVAAHGAIEMEVSFMFFMIGMLPGQKRLNFQQMAVCSCCGQYGQVEVYMTYMSLLLFFLPIFHWQKRYFVRMSCCGAVAEIDPRLGRDIARGHVTEIDLSRLSFQCGGTDDFSAYSGWSGTTGRSNPYNGWDDGTAGRADPYNGWRAGGRDDENRSSGENSTSRLPDHSLKRCPSCGYETTEDFQFCPKCGQRL